MGGSYSVKGSTIRMKFEFVRDRFGTEAEGAMRAHFAGRTELWPLLDTSWVPFPLYDEINRYIADTHFGGAMERLREVGAYSAERGLASTYKAWIRGKDLASFLKQFGDYYPTYYSQGELVAEELAGGRSFSLAFRRAPVYTRAELEIAAGYFLGACKVMGLDGATCGGNFSRAGMDLVLQLP